MGNTTYETYGPTSKHLSNQELHDKITKDMSQMKKHEDIIRNYNPASEFLSKQYFGSVFTINHYSCGFSTIQLHNFGRKNPKHVVKTLKKNNIKLYIFQDQNIEEIIINTGIEYRLIGERSTGVRKKMRL